MSRQVTVAPERIAAWLAGFERRNGPIADAHPADGQTVLSTALGGEAIIHGRESAATEVGSLVADLLTRGRAAIVLVRRGGYSIGSADFDGAQSSITASKTGSRYVQGRTAAGGQSQQRFARRRANQANELVGAATAAARRVLGDQPGQVDLLVTGGDPQLVDGVLAAPPLSRLGFTDRVHVEVGEPRRKSLDEALSAARAISITVTNADPEEAQ